MKTPIRVINAASFGIAALYVAATISLATPQADEPKDCGPIVETPTAKKGSIWLWQSVDVLHSNMKPLATVNLPYNATMELYSVGRGTAETLIINGQVVQIDFHKGGSKDLPMSAPEIQSLAVEATGIHRWAQLNERAWVVTSDDDSEKPKVAMLYGKFNGNYENVVVIITQPAVDYWTKSEEDAQGSLPQKHGTPKPHSNLITI